MRRGWIGLAVLVGLLVVMSGVRLASALEHARAARAIGVSDPLAACTEARAAADDAAPFLAIAPAFGLVPLDRTRAWAQVPALADAARHGCAAAEAGQRLTAGMHAAGDASAGTALLRSVRERQDEIQTIGRELRALANALERIDPALLAGEERLASLAPLVTAARARVPELRAAADLAPASVVLLDRLLGADRPRNYLLLGQNNDEIRATGGFIGTLGVLTVADGAIASSDMRSSYLWEAPNLPLLPAPGPLQKYMNFGAWFMRDANWWIDYRRSVAQLLLMWDRAQGNAAGIDGVIAVDRQALDLLLDAVGGVDVPELGGTVTAANVGTLLDDRRRVGALGSFADYHRVKTEALSGVYGALMKKLVSVRGMDLVRVLAALGRAAEDKHVLIWLRDGDLQRVAAARGWDGRFEPGDGDFLAVIDTSVSYGKVGPFIDRRVEYQRQGDGTSVVRITYSNRYQPVPGAAWDPILDGTWWDWRQQTFEKEQGAWLGYIRVGAPPASRLISADGWDDPPSSTLEGQVVIFGAPLLLRPGQTRTVQLAYANPTPTSAPLDMFRQPGTP